MAGSRILDDCGELAASRLVETLVPVLQQMGKELQQLAVQTPHHEMSMLYLEGMEFLRDHASGIEIGFWQAFFKEFKRSCRKGMLARDPGAQAGG